MGLTKGPTDSFPFSGRNLSRSMSSGLNPMNGLMSGGFYQAARSVGVIAFLEYIEPTISNALRGLTYAYGDLLGRAIATYLEFCAYAQGWISAPSSMLLSA